MNAQLVEMTEDEYEEYLDEIYPDGVNICGMTYSAGQTLRKVDSIAFRCSMSDMPNRWKCDSCDCTYDDEDEAENCCKD